jgi:hypothetical protein
MDNIVKELINAAHYHPSADNSQPLSYRITQQGFVAYYDEKRVSGLTFEATNPAIRIAIGAMIWNVEQRGQEIGVDVEYSLNDDLTEVSFTVEGEPKNALNSESLVYQRCSNRAPFLPIDQATLIELEDLFAEEPALLVSDDQKQSWIDLTQTASSIRFQVREIHELLSKAITYDSNPESGLSLASLGLPCGAKPMVRWISDWKNLSRMNRIGAYKLLASEEVKLLKKAGVIGVVYTEDDNYIEAGKATGRLWSRINQLGLSVHPYYVITDITHRYREQTLPKDFTDEARKVLASYHKWVGPNYNPVIMFRIGNAKKVLPRSGRYPVEELITS